MSTEEEEEEEEEEELFTTSIARSQSNFVYGRHEILLSFLVLLVLLDFRRTFTSAVTFSC
jgi:hypothetical protein